VSIRAQRRLVWTAVWAFVIHIGYMADQPEWYIIPAVALFALNLLGWSRAVTS
jgi:hypothetical protein